METAGPLSLYLREIELPLAGACAHVGGVASRESLSAYQALGRIRADHFRSHNTNAEEPAIDVVVRHCHA